MEVLSLLMSTDSRGSLGFADFWQWFSRRRAVVRIQRPRRHLPRLHVHFRGRDPVLPIDGSVQDRFHDDACSGRQRKDHCAPVVSHGGYLGFRTLRSYRHLAPDLRSTDGQCSGNRMCIIHNPHLGSYWQRHCHFVYGYHIGRGALEYRAENLHPRQGEVGSRHIYEPGGNCSHCLHCQVEQIALAVNLASQHELTIPTGPW